MKKDDWEKPRSKGQHLNEEEIGQIKRAYQTGLPYHEIARELKCSSRIACKYYGFFAAEGVVKNIDKPLPTVAPSRFYKSTFEI